MKPSGKKGRVEEGKVYYTQKAKRQNKSKEIQLGIFHNNFSFTCSGTLIANG